MKSFFRLLAKIFYLFKALFSKEPPKETEHYSLNKKEEEKSPLLKHYEMIDALIENINQEVEIHSDNLIRHQQNQISTESFIVKGKILDVDDHWIKMECYPSKYLKVRGPDYLYFRTEVIIDFVPLKTEDNQKNLANERRL